MKKYRFILLLALAALLAGCGSAPETEAPVETAIAEAPLLSFTGSLNGEDLELQYFEDSYTLKVGGHAQTIPLTGRLMVSSVGQGFQIVDLNQDGMDDVLIELGIRGQCMPMDCFLWQSHKTQGPVLLPEFENLMIPRWSEELNMVINEWHNGPGEYAIERYVIEDDRLVLVESLTWSYETGSPLYTVRKTVDGELVTVLDQVPEREIDLDSWYQ